MTRSRRRRKTNSQKSHNEWRIGCLIIFIALIPIGYGVYLFYQQNHLSTTLQPSPSSNSAIQIEESQATKTTTNSGNKQIKKTVNATRYSVKELEKPILPSSYTYQLIQHRGYTVSYNKDLRLPNWVSYELTRQETQGKEKRNNRFISDPQAKGRQASNADYKRSGYDKGHMAPAGDMKWNKQAMNESFYFTNICPQHPQLNRRAWKNLEEEIRDWAIADSALIIICGPITSKNPQRIGENKVAIPTQFFKVILAPYAKPMRAIAFLFHNRMSVEPISTYAIPVDHIEQITGIDFFAPLPDSIENKIEAEADIRKWPR